MDSTSKSAVSNKNSTVENSYKNAIKDNFFTTLTSLYKNKELSDKVLQIIEKQSEETVTKDQLKDEHRLFLPRQTAFPIHSLVFCINSKFFKSLFYDSDMMETKLNTIVLHVNPGDIQYVELLIKSFYNPDILNNTNIITMLKILEYADRYLCDSILKQGLSILQNIAVVNVNECNFLLNKIAYFEHSLGHLINKDFFLKVKSCCSQLLTQEFTPLECMVYSVSFDVLNFSSFLTLLKSEGEFLFSENSVVTCIIKWFEANQTEQTKENIEALLSECRYEHMDVLFLRNGLCHTNSIFSKWPDYLNWYINAVSYPSIQHDNITSKRNNRKIKVDAHGNLINKVKTINNATKKDIHHEYKLEMKYNANTNKWTADKKMMYRGYVLQLTIYLCNLSNKIIIEMKLRNYIKKKK